MTDYTSDLRAIFCFELIRTMSNDWVVRYGNRYFQLLEDRRKDIRPKRKVTVSRWLDGSIHILHQKKEISYEKSNPQADLLQFQNSNIYPVGSYEHAKPSWHHNP